MIFRLLALDPFGDLASVLLFPSLVIENSVGVLINNLKMRNDCPRLPMRLALAHREAGGAIRFSRLLRTRN